MGGCKARGWMSSCVVLSCWAGSTQRNCTSKEQLKNTCYITLCDCMYSELSPSNPESNCGLFLIKKVNFSIRWRQVIQINALESLRRKKQFDTSVLQISVCTTNTMLFFIRLKLGYISFYLWKAYVVYTNIMTSEISSVPLVNPS